MLGNQRKAPGPVEVDGKDGWDPMSVRQVRPAPHVFRLACLVYFVRWMLSTRLEGLYEVG